MHKVRGERVPFPSSLGKEAVSVVFIVGSQLNIGEVVSSCAARGRYDIIWNLDGLLTAL